MKKRLSACIFALCLFPLFLGCSSQTVTPKVNAQSTKGAFSTKLESYLAALSAGGQGETFWCKASDGLEKAPFAVRSTKILQEQEHKYSEDFGDVNGKLFVLQIESSTKGGSPIAKNWLLTMSTESDKTPCVRTLYEKD